MPTTRTRPRNSVSIQYALARRGVPSARALRSWVSLAEPSFDVTVRIVGAREGRLLNARFRKRSAATNVLSFAYDGRGDIVLCHPVIAREARAQGKALAAHYAHLVVHGVLHLNGYAHERHADATRMERREIRLLRRIGVADPYAVK